MNAMLHSLRRALHPIDKPPTAPGWNREEVIDLIGDRERQPAAVLLPLRQSDGQTNLLFTYRTKHLSRHAGQVSFPGGRLEPTDADVRSAALRETQEEIGLDPASVEPLGYLDTLETISGFYVTPMVAIIDPEAPLRADPQEVSEMFEVPLAFLLDPENLGTRAIRWRGRSREVFEFHYAGHTIWGVTAAILVNLMRRMERL